MLGDNGPMVGNRVGTATIMFTDLVASTELRASLGETAADRLVMGAGEVFGEVGEGRVEKTEERAEGSLVTAVGSGGDQQEVAVGVRRQTRDQLVTLVHDSLSRQ